MSAVNQTSFFFVNRFYLQVLACLRRRSYTGLLLHALLNKTFSSLHKRTLKRSRLKKNTDLQSETRFVESLFVKVKGIFKAELVSTWQKVYNHVNHPGCIWSQARFIQYLFVK